MEVEPSPESIPTAKPSSLPSPVVENDGSCCGGDSNAQLANNKRKVDEANLDASPAPGPTPMPAAALTPSPTPAATATSTVTTSAVSSPTTANGTVNDSGTVSGTVAGSFMVSGTGTGTVTGTGGDTVNGTGTGGDTVNGTGIGTVYGTGNGSGTVTPPPTPLTTATIPTPTTAATSRHGRGSCAEMAIALDSSSGGSSDEEDETDVPVGSSNISSIAPSSRPPSGPASASVQSPRVSIKLSSAAVLAAAAAPRGVARIPGGSAAAAAVGARGTGSSNGWGHGAEAAGIGYNNGHHRATNGYANGNGMAGAGKYANSNGNGAAASGLGVGKGSSSSPPGLKRKGSNGYQRKVGRPVGSRSRRDDDDPEYVERGSPQRRVGAGYASNAADRPRRQPGIRKRWADEMMNPGEQWLRKTPKAPQALPPNPVDASIPDAPTFYPTVEQFRDPLSYIESIRPMAESYGIAKIVPPRGWNPPPTPMNVHARKRVPTKKQALHSLMNSDEVYDDGRNFTIVDYKIMADRFSEYWRNRGDPELKARKAPPVEPQTPKVETPPGATPAEFHEAARENVRLRRLEREYWNVVDGGVEEAEVEYANDLNISDFWSGFPLPPKNFMDGSSYDRSAPCRFDDPEYYKTCGWNLNNLPFWPGSVLRFFRTHVNGLTAPWLYLGMQFATFAWHNEDNYLYSLNYHHSGAAKQWYGIPGKHAKGFEACLAKELGETLDTVSEHLYRITKMLSPVYLQQANVPVCRLQQLPGQFVVTFPKAYHAGFSYGFNCGEAVNFAVPDWISYSRESTEAYRTASRMAALSHDKMVATLTMYLPDHDVKGCELVVRELKRIHKEELDHRVSLELEGVQDPARQGVPLPRFRLGLIEKDTEEYDERRVCKTCKHTLFMTGVACPCSDVDVSCLRCAREACSCPVSNKYLLSWWREDDLSRFVRTAETYLRKLRDGQADEVAVASFRANINPF